MIDARSRYVESPARLFGTREIIKEEYELMMEELNLRESHSQAYIEAMEVKIEEWDKVKECLMMLRTSLQIKEQKWSLKKQIKKEFNAQIEISQKNENIATEIAYLSNELNGVEQNERSYQEQYFKLKHEVKSKLDNETYNKLDFLN